MNYKIRSASIHLSRAIYALNWFNIAPGLRNIESSLDLKIIQIGIITTAFYIGLASFQLVGGILASKIGNRKTSFLGLIILGTSVIASGMAMNLPEMFISRLFAGTGAALYFSPALAMLSGIVPENEYSLHVGIYNGAFNVGAGIGIFGWGFLDEMIGWRLGLVIGGALLIAVAVENYLILRNVQESKVSGKDMIKRLARSLSSLTIWILPVAAAAGVLTETIMGQLFVYYEETHLSMPSSLAVTIGAFAMIFGALGGVIGGYHFGKTKRQMGTFAATLMILGVLVMTIPLYGSPLILSLMVSIIGMFTVSSFSILYAITAQRTKDKTMVSFSLAFVNLIQLVIAAVAPIIFTTLVFYSGYSLSWIIIGLISFLCVFLLVLVPKPDENRSAISPFASPESPK